MFVLKYNNQYLKYDIQGRVTTTDNINLATRYNNKPINTVLYLQKQNYKNIEIVKI
jgi:hypothetical protein